MSELPEDIQKQWHNVTRRMQSIAKSEGLSVVVARVLVKKDGTPLQWNVESRLLEPKGLQNALIELITGGESD